MKTKKQKQTKDAAARLVKFVAARTEGWWSLNMQVRWAIDNILLEECGVPHDRLSMVKMEMSWADGDEKTFWYRFFCFPATVQFELAHKALAAVGR